MYETRYQHFSRYRQKQSFPIVNLELLKRFNPSQALSSKQWLHELRLEEARLQRQHHHFMQDLAKNLIGNKIILLLWHVFGCNRHITDQQKLLLNR
ncbi:MAG: hypothetical protein HWD59_01105 [Coxiellaceae bacterium]|nr:MAG: hypothetical protein HWD59_01105 [Coxiellaceae bacterium]